MNARTLSLLALLLPAAAASLWLARSTSRPPATPAPPAAGQADSFAEDMVLERLDAGGRLRYRLRAARMAHYAAGDRTRLRRVRAEIHADPAPPWRLVADRATSERGDRRILLTGHVRLDRAGYDHKPPVHAETPMITLYPDRRQADTPAPVSYRRGRLSAQARGMHADLARDRLELRTQVRMRYLPQVAP